MNKSELLHTWRVGNRVEKGRIHLAGHAAFRERCLSGLTLGLIPKMQSPTVSELNVHRAEILLLRNSKAEFAPVVQNSRQVKRVASRVCFHIGTCVWRTRLQRARYSRCLANLASLCAGVSVALLSMARCKGLGS